MWTQNSIINYMKAVYIALMLGSMGGSIALFIHGFDRYETRLLEGILSWLLSIVVAGLGFYSFKQASKIGTREDNLWRY